MRLGLVINWTGPRETAQAIRMLRTPRLARERRSDNTHSEYAGQYTREPRYFVGIDEMSTFRERTHEIYGDIIRLLTLSFSYIEFEPSRTNWVARLWFDERTKFGYGMG